ncbi:MAG: hypothetical protein RL632_2117 [Bacteroidota bacterium]|jgi:hypothetical protein
MVKQQKKDPHVSVEMVIASPIDQAFNYIVPVELSHIFKRYKFLPAVVKTNETEQWIRPGLSRTVFFDDGSTSKETLLTVVPYTSFSYEIFDFTSQLRFLAKKIEGNFQFIDLGNARVQVTWTYKIVPMNSLTKLFIRCFLVKAVRGLMYNALSTLKNDLES